jgi:hypothetical protein
LDDAVFPLSLLAGDDAGAPASGTFVLCHHFEPAARPLDRIIKVYLNFRAEVGSADRLGREAKSVHSAARAKPFRRPPEKLLKEVAEIARSEVPIAATTARCRFTRVPAHHLLLGDPVFPVRSEFVVLLALGRITQDLVRLVDFLELLFGVLVSGIDVGMMFAGEFAIGALDVGFTGGALDAENLVVVAELHPGGPYSKMRTNLRRASVVEKSGVRYEERSEGASSPAFKSFRASRRLRSASSSRSRNDCRRQMNATYRKIAAKMMLYATNR